MLNKRVLISCLILAVSAAALQTIPRILGPAFVFTGILSGFLVYFAAQLNWFLGFAVYLTASALSASMDMGEAVFFICTNGIIGLSLGIIKDRFKNIYLVPVLSALLVTVMLCIVNYLFGINSFGYSAPKALIPQALTLFLPLYIYCFICLKLAMSAYNLLHKYINFHIY